MEIDWKPGGELEYTLQLYLERFRTPRRSPQTKQVLGASSVFPNTSDATVEEWLRGDLSCTWTSDMWGLPMSEHLGSLWNIVLGWCLKPSPEDRTHVSEMLSLMCKSLELDGDVIINSDPKLTLSSVSNDQCQERKGHTHGVRILELVWNQRHKSIVGLCPSIDRPDGEIAHVVISGSCIVQQLLDDPGTMRMDVEVDLGRWILSEGI